MEHLVACSGRTVRKMIVHSDQKGLPVRDVMMLTLIGLLVSYCMYVTVMLLSHKHYTHTHTCNMQITQVNNFV